MSQADRTMEIDANDILEEEVVPGGRSISPLVIDADSEPSLERRASAEDTVKIRISRTRQTALWAVPIGLGGLCLMLVIAIAARPRDAARASTGASSPVAVAAHAPPPAPHADSSPWTAIAAAPPPPTTGTISAARAAGVLVVDGVRATSAAVVVSCGTHTLRVGRGSLKTVNVPCGGNLAVDRSGRISAR